MKLQSGILFFLSWRRRRINILYVWKIFFDGCIPATQHILVRRYIASLVHRWLIFCPPNKLIAIFVSQGWLLTLYNRLLRRLWEVDDCGGGAILESDVENAIFVELRWGLLMKYRFGILDDEVNLLLFEGIANFHALSILSQLVIIVTIKHFQRPGVPQLILALGFFRLEVLPFIAI